MTKYTVLKNDCLSLLAQKYHTTTDALLSLNSEQIKNPDLIFEGQKLTLPDLDTETIKLDGSRIELPKPPSSLTGGSDTCSPPIDIEDVLYVPSHPINGKAYWYGITDTAKQVIEQEKALLDGLVVEGNVEATTQNLSKLGVLSKFQAKVFEQFMTPEAADDYKTLNLFKWVITRHLYITPDQDAFELLYSMAEKADIDTDSLKAKVKHWRRYTTNLANQIKQADTLQQKAELTRQGIDAVSGASINTAQEAAKHQAKIDQYVLDKLHNTVLEAVSDLIDDMEAQAKREASQINADDGTLFVYQDELKYFTSEQELLLQRSVKDLASQYDELKLAQQPHEQAQAQVMALQNSETQSIVYVTALAYLNRQGIVVKEQCLPLSSLEGDSATNQGPATLNQHMPNWREPGQVIDINQTSGSSQDSLIRALYKECKGKADTTKVTEALVNDAKLGWSYYPTLALIALIDETIKKHQANLTQIFNATAPVDELFNQLLWVKKVAKMRLTLLKKSAQNRLNQDNPTLEFTPRWAESLPANLTLLWDTTYIPKEKIKQGFINQAQLNDIQIVECSLLSSGEVFYLRGPHWYMPEKQGDMLCALSAEHVQDITGRITFSEGQSSSQSAQTSFADALKQLKKPEATLDFIALSKEAQFDTAFWQDGYHYQNGVSPTGSSAQYSADAGAQLFRFTSKAAATLNTPLSDYQNLIKKPKELGGSGVISGTFSALQAQASFTFWLPLSRSDSGKVQGQAISLTYQNANQQEKPYSAGCMAAIISGSVYGMAGASCQLSSKVAFGPSDTNSDNIGIKGSNLSLLDPNIQRKNVLLPGPLSANKAIEAGASVDVFAGVEAGGSLGATVYWQPPSDNWAALGSINGALSAAYGAGFNADFRVLFQGSTLVLVSSAKLVFGPGASGKVAINLDTQKVDQFVDTLLGVLKQHDFKRLSVFGEVDKDGKNEDFTLLNNVLTIAMAYGLGVADVLLMPMSTWGEYKQNSLRQEYAPFVATNILRADRQARMKSWVTKLPPETLCNVFTCLLQEQDKPYQRFTVAQSNHRLAESLVQIMQWLVEDEKTQTEEGDKLSSKRQWKEALIRMNDDPAILQDKPLQWQSFKNNWFKIAGVVKQFDTTSALNIIDNFNKSSQVLCKNMVLTYSDEMETTEYYAGQLMSYQRPVRRYYAYPASIVAKRELNQPIQIKDGNGELMTKDNEIVTEWTINATLS